MEIWTLKNLEKTLNFITDKEWEPSVTSYQTQMAPCFIMVEFALGRLWAAKYSIELRCSLLQLLLPIDWDNCCTADKCVEQGTFTLNL